MSIDAFIFGARGQDGRLLSDYLLKEGLSIVGGSRRADGIEDNRRGIQYVQVDYQDVNLMVHLLKHYQPRYIFNFAANSSVGYSFENPYDSQNSFLTPFLCILEGLRVSEIDARLFVANSGEVFGNNSSAKITDEMKAHSPYALARIHGAKLCSLYKNLYGLNIISAFLYPHESFYRSKSFFLPKLVSELLEIKYGKKRYAYFGDLSGVRDFSWAADFMKGFTKAMLYSETENYIFASGRGVSLREVADYTLNKLGLDHSCLVENDPSMKRNSDLKISVGDPSFTTQKLNWSVNVAWEEIVERYIER